LKKAASQVCTMMLEQCCSFTPCALQLHSN
jgi:hypothetical protein